MPMVIIGTAIGTVTRTSQVEPNGLNSLPFSPRRTAIFESATKAANRAMSSKPPHHRPPLSPQPRLATSSQLPNSNEMQPCSLLGGPPGQRQQPAGRPNRAIEPGRRCPARRLPRGSIGIRTPLHRGGCLSSGQTGFRLHLISPSAVTPRHQKVQTAQGKPVRPREVVDHDRSSRLPRVPATHRAERRSATGGFPASGPQPGPQRTLSAHRSRAVAECSGVHLADT
ncbi:hypothetical protein LV75_002600 [Actinokineospora diospyrosa]|uniref:Uncharacterized protein n=1 Tax=Actinokineospora diospyrosa TaxID=103728 RepID=A0ABT1IBU0_9PSEU|nr:hypothetical protein [Actinokineospora diospyrosa]